MNQVKSVSAVKYFFVKIAHWFKKKSIGKLYLKLCVDTEESYAKIKKLQDLLVDARALIKEINKTKVYLDVVKKERPS